MLAKFIPRPGIFQLIIAYQITRNFPTCKSIYENWSDFQIIAVYRFSAYWLRSSVVSVLISLISGKLCINTALILILFVAARYGLGFTPTVPRVASALHYSRKRPIQEKMNNLLNFRYLDKAKNSLSQGARFKSYS